MVALPGRIQAQIAVTLSHEGRGNPYLQGYLEADALPHDLSRSAANPGRSPASRNSRDAPPPVEIWLILLTRPAWVRAATVSPPTTLKLVVAATASAKARVPRSKGGISNTPIGPFHRIVRAD